MKENGSSITLIMLKVLNFQFSKIDIKAMIAALNTQIETINENINAMNRNMKVPKIKNIFPKLE